MTTEVAQAPTDAPRAIEAGRLDADVVFASPPAAPTNPRGSGRPERPALAIAGTALIILAAVLLGFAAQVLVLSHIQHDRDQDVAFADYRAALSRATAPVGQLNESEELWPLGTSVALIEIPGLGINEVVGEGTTSGVLASGPGHRRDTPLPGQPGVSVIMGRNFAYGGPFSDIGLLPRDAVISVTTGQGEHEYRVIGVRRAGDPQPTTLEPGAGRMTLISAEGPWYLPDEVVRVDTRLVSETQPAPRRVIAPGTLPPEEGVMAGDPSVWVSIVLWGQAMVLAAGGIVWLASRWGRWQAWTIGVPVLAVLAVKIADQVTQLLPNLI